MKQSIRMIPMRFVKNSGCKGCVSVFEAFLLIAAFGFLLLFATGCAITPHLNKPSVPRISETGNADDGIIASLEDHSIVITQSRYEEYCWLIERYGDKTVPKTPKDYMISKFGSDHYKLEPRGINRYQDLIFLYNKDQLHTP